MACGSRAGLEVPKVWTDHAKPKRAAAVLEEMKSSTEKWEWVFLIQVSPKKHMSNATILRPLDRMGCKCRMTEHGFRALASPNIK